MVCAGVVLVVASVGVAGLARQRVVGPTVVGALVVRFRYPPWVGQFAEAKVRL